MILPCTHIGPSVYANRQPQLSCPVFGSSLCRQHFKGREAVLALEHVDLVRTWVMTAGTAVWLTLDILVIWFITSDCRTHGCFLTTACWVLLQFKTQFCMQHISCIRVRVCVCLFIVNL